MALSAPRWIALVLPSPSLTVCTGERTYANVTTKISGIDGLPSFLIRGAPWRIWRADVDDFYRHPPFEICLSSLKHLKTVIIHSRVLKHHVKSLK